MLGFILILTIIILLCVIVNLVGLIDEIKIQRLRYQEIIRKLDHLEFRVNVSR